jgi:hypothetical protein
MKRLMRLVAGSVLMAIALAVVITGFGLVSATATHNSAASMVEYGLLF